MAINYYASRCVLVRGRSLGAASAGLFLACWVVFLLQLVGLARLPDLPRLTLTQLYSAASVLGWVAGMIYVQRTRHLAPPLRRRLFLLSFCGPPSLVYLLAAMARLQLQAPLVLLAHVLHMTQPVVTESEPFVG